MRRALPVLLLWLAALGCEAMIKGDLDSVGCLDEGKVGPPTCPVGLQCTKGECAPIASGAPCTADTDCSGGDFCLDPVSFHGAGPARCTHPCCTSSDCDPDPSSVCWIPPVGGGSFCRPAADIGRTGVGSLGALAHCDTDADCRSGRCTTGLCLDTCCTDTSCEAGGGTCQAGQPPLREAPGFWCGIPQGHDTLYSACKSDAECASGLCLSFGGTFLCSAPCCSSTDCQDLGNSPVRCVMIGGNHPGVRACLTDSGTGPGAVGAPCKAGTDCRSGLCLELTGHFECSDLCCSDDSCGHSGLFACRPAILDNAWALRCEPK